MADRDRPSVDVPARIHRLVKRIVMRTVRPLNAGVTRLLAFGDGARENLSDVRTVPVGRDVEARVGWIDREHDHGPTCSIFGGGQELLRLDLFDEHPHIHYGLAQQRLHGSASARVLIPESSTAEHIDRAAYEIQHNLRWCLHTHPSRRVRAIRLSDAELEAAADRVRSELCELDRRHRT
jgi:hypothetical protein